MSKEVVKAIFDENIAGVREDLTFDAYFDSIKGNEEYKKGLFENYVNDGTKSYEEFNAETFGVGKPEAPSEVGGAESSPTGLGLNESEVGPPAGGTPPGAEPVGAPVSEAIEPIEPGEPEAPAVTVGLKEFSIVDNKKDKGFLETIFGWLGGEKTFERVEKPFEELVPARQRLFQKGASKKLSEQIGGVFAEAEKSNEPEKIVDLASKGYLSTNTFANYLAGDFASDKAAAEEINVFLEKGVEGQSEAFKRFKGSVDPIIAEQSNEIKKTMLKDRAYINLNKDIDREFARQRAEIDAKYIGIIDAEEQAKLDEATVGLRAEYDAAMLSLPTKNDVLAKDNEMFTKYQLLVNDGKMDVDTANAELEKWRIAYEAELLAKEKGAVNAYNSGLEKAAEKIKSGLKDTEEYKQYISELNELRNGIITSREGDLRAIQTRIQGDLAPKYNERINSVIRDSSSGPTPLLEKSGLLPTIQKVINNKGFDLLPFDQKKAFLDRAFGNVVVQLREKGVAINDGTVAQARNEFDDAVMSKAYFTQKGTPSLYMLKTRAIEEAEKLDEAIASEKKNILTREGPDVGPSYGEFTPQSSIYSFTSKSLKELQLAREKLQEIIDLPESMTDNEFKNFWNGLTSGQFVDYLPFVSGLKNLAGSLALYRSLEDDTPASRYLQNAVALGNSYRGVYEANNMASDWYKAGSATAESLPFMGEFVFTAGMGSLARKSTEKVVAKLFGEVAERTIVAKGMRVLAGTVVGALAQTTANPQRYLDETIKRMTPQMSIAFSDEGDDLVAMLDESTPEGGFEAFLKGYGVTASEYFSENLGFAGARALKYAGSKMMQNEFLKRAYIGWYMSKLNIDMPTAFKRLAEKGGWNGFFAEFGEELANMPLTNLITGDADVMAGIFKESGDLDIENLMEVGRALVPISAFGLGANVLGITVKSMTPESVTISYRDANNLPATETIDKGVWEKVTEALKSPNKLREFISNELPRLKVEGKAREILTRELEAGLSRFERGVVESTMPPQARGSAETQPTPRVSVQMKERKGLSADKKRLVGTGKFDFVVTIDGKEQRITRAEYNEYKRSGKLPEGIGADVLGEVDKVEGAVVESTKNAESIKTSLEGVEVPAELGTIENVAEVYEQAKGKEELTDEEVAVVDFVEGNVAKVEGVSETTPEVAKEQPVDKKDEVERKRKEVEPKIERKDLFTGVGEFSTQLGGSDKAAVPVSHKKINGIEFVEYAHPETGSVDVIVTGKTDNDFVGFYRLYENGKPTNKWSSKFENQSRNKEDFKTMISGVQDMLPEEHEYTEKRSISTDGLRVWEQQLQRGYELQYDSNGKLITNSVFINGDAIVNELGVPVNKGAFDNIRVTSREDFEKVKKALLPYLEKFGLNENNIKWVSGNIEVTPQNEKAFAPVASVKIDLPVLKKATPEAKPAVSPLQDVESTAKALEGVDLGETYYHGTPTEGINELEVNSKGLLFFTKDKNIAERYATNDFEGNTPSNNVFEKKLIAKNIFDPEKESNNKEIIELLANTGNFENVGRFPDYEQLAENALDAGEWSVLETKGFIDELKKLGYDGIYIDNRPYYLENAEGFRSLNRDVAVFNKSLAIPNSNKAISEAYHKAKADNSNPELVKAVEELLGKPAEAKPAVSPLQDVESTTKALEGVDVSKIETPLTERQFDKKYVAQHKDLSGKRNDTWKENKGEILKSGLREGVNVNALPIYTGTERNVIDQQYGNRKGDIIYILPKEGVTEGRNGYKTKEGYIPKLSEVVVIEYDKQSTYEAYRNQLSNPSYISEAYHKAKADNSNPKLVKAVEELLGKPAEAVTPEGVSAEGVTPEVSGTAEVAETQPIAEKQPSTLKEKAKEAEQRAQEDAEKIKKLFRGRNGGLGISPFGRAKRLAEIDKAILTALASYVRNKFLAGAYTFKDFVKDMKENSKRMFGVEIKVTAQDELFFNQSASMYEIDDAFAGEIMGLKDDFIFSIAAMSGRINMNFEEFVASNQSLVDQFMDSAERNYGLNPAQAETLVRAMYQDALRAAANRDQLYKTEADIKNYQDNAILGNRAFQDISNSNKATEVARRSNSISRLYDGFLRAFVTPTLSFDRVFRLSKDRLSLEREVYASRKSRMGASTKAANWYSDVQKKIFGGLSWGQLERLNEYIIAKRILDVEEKRNQDVAYLIKLNEELADPATTDDRKTEINEELAKLGNLGKIKNGAAFIKLNEELADPATTDDRKAEINEELAKLGNLGEIKHGSAMLNGKKVELTVDFAQGVIDANSGLDAKSIEIRERAEIYTKANNELLKMRLDAGLISQAAYDSMIKRDYVRRIFLDLSASTIDAVDYPSISAKIKAIKEGSTDKSLEMDTQALLQLNAAATFDAVAKNNFINKVAKWTKNNQQAFLDKALAKFKEKFKKKNGIDPSPDEIKKFLKEQTLFKRIGKNKAPKSGFEKVSYFVNGVEKSMAVRSDLAGVFQTASGRSPVQNKQLISVISKLNLTGLIKASAVFFNPAFALGNFALDVVHASMVTRDLYKSFSANLGVILAKALGITAENVYSKAVNYGGSLFGMAKRDSKFDRLVKDYFAHGGGMTFMSEIGSKMYTKRMAQSQLGKAKSVAVDNANKIISVFNSIQSGSELITRVIIYEAALEKNIKEYKKQNGVEPTGADLTSIKESAAASAADLIDFREGTNTTKGLDQTIFPFLNAMIQGARAEIDFIAKNPAVAATRLIEFGGMTLAVALYNAKSGEDDEKEGIIGYNGVSEYIKANYFVMMMPWTKKNEKGEVVRPYVSIKLPAMLKSINIFVEGTVSSRGASEVTSQMAKALKGGYVPEIGAASPTTQAVFALTANKDFFRKGAKVYRGKEEVLSPERFNIGETKKIYRDLFGAAYDLMNEEGEDKGVLGFDEAGPAQWQAAIEKAISSNNPYYLGITSGYANISGLYGEKNQKEVDALYDDKLAALNSLTMRVYRTPESSVQNSNSKKREEFKFLEKQIGSWQQRNTNTIKGVVSKELREISESDKKAFLLDRFFDQKIFNYISDAELIKEVKKAGIKKLPENLDNIQEFIKEEQSRMSIQLVEAFKPNFIFRHPSLKEYNLAKNSYVGFNEDLISGIKKEYDKSGDRKSYLVALKFVAGEDYDEIVKQIGAHPRDLSFVEGIGNGKSAIKYKKNYFRPNDRSSKMMSSESAINNLILLKYILKNE